ncbi:MAG: lysophospholipid acyltransferase family protein [Bacillota bacterium]|nr:lysophospholipid acyltransferase family protein [Bacillota bacterium]
MKKIKTLLHKAIYHFARLLVSPVLKARYSFQTDKLPELGEPYILLSNHTTEIDMLFVGMASKKHMYFVCGEHLLRNRHYGKLLRWLADPIPIPKGGASLKAIREILARIKAGHNVMMFPEGKRSFHGETIPAGKATGGLVQKAGCALVTYRIRGGYFVYPRWARAHQRRGHIEGRVVGVYSSRELASMTAQEITDIINRDTYENAYATQREKMWLYKGKDRAACMEHYLFICPSCGAFDSIQSSGDDFHCSACGMSGFYDDYGFLRGEGLPYDNVLDWGRWIEKVFDERVSGQQEELLFVEKAVQLYRMLDDYRNQDIMIGDLYLYRDRMMLGEYKFSFDEISALSMLYGNILLFTHGDSYFGMTGDRFRAWKCGRLWHLCKGDTEDKTKEL